MLVSSLALTMATAISGGCGPIATSNTLANIKNSASEIIMTAKEEYDFEQYSLTFNENQSFIKQKLYQYAEENQIFTIEELNNLEATIKTDSDYIVFEDLNNIYVKGTKTSALNTNEQINNNMDVIKKNMSSSSVNKNLVMNNKVINNNFTKIDYITDLGDNGSSQTTSEETYQLPIKTNDVNKISSSVNGKVDGCTFFGLICSKEACVGLYNILAGWINKQVMYKASGSGSPLSIIVEGFKQLSNSDIVGPALTALTATVISSITGAISTLWAEFCSLFTAGGPIGIIIGIVIALIGTACIGVIVSMIVYGFLNKGFAVGWKIHNIFNWEWFCGDLA